MAIKQMKKLTLIFYILIACCTLTRAIDYDSYKVDLRDGIISTDIRTMAQDDMGYIWFGSTYGLVRYDGFFFHTYLSTSDGNTSLLPDNHIREVINWCEGLLVVRTQGAMCVLFDTRANKFIPFPIKNEVCCKYNRIWLDRNRRLWFFDGMGRGVSIICKGRQFKKRFYSKKNSVPADIRENKYDNQGNTYELINNEYLKYYDRKRKREYVFKIFEQSPFAMPYMVRYNVLAIGDNIWVSTYGSGITVYNTITGELTNIRKGHGGTLQSNFIISIMADRQGNVWALQDMHGVVCISTGKKLQKTISFSTNADNEQANFVKSMCYGGKNTLLVGTNNGQIMKLNTNFKTLSNSRLQRDAPLSMLKLSTGEIAMGTRSHGVCIGGVWFKHNDADIYSPSDNKIIDMAEDMEGRIWMATQNGNLDVAIKNGNTYIFRHLLPQKGYHTVTIDHKGNVWAGSETMLFNFNPRRILCNPSAYTGYNVSGTKSGVNDINHVIEDDNGRIWVATLGKGVFWADNNGNRPGKFNRLSFEDGLVNDMVAAIEQDRFGHIWIATQRGITVYDPQTKKMRNVFADSSTGSNTYSDRCVCRLPDGRLVFGTIAGLAAYNPQKDISKLGKFGNKHGKNSLSLTDILVNGTSIIGRHDDGLIFNKKGQSRIKLQHNENSLTFRFSNFNYNALYKTQYQFILEGYDHEWSPLTTIATATYRELPTGSYTFKVRALCSDTNAVEYYSVKIIILPPWWLSWWALLLYLLFFVSVGIATYRQLKTIYKLRQKISFEKKMTDFKLRFFTDISHEFRTPLTIIHGAVDTLIQSKNLPGELKQSVWGIARNENRMMRLINQLLEFRKMENGKLRLALQETDVVAFLRNIFNVFKKTAENKRINYMFSTQQKSIIGFIDRGHVDKIAYNIIGNAFKYTPAGGDITVRISTNETERNIVISVADTGVGVPKEKRNELFKRFSQSSYTGNSMGIGLNLTQELVKVHHGEILFSENLPKGSVFTVILPLDKNEYTEEDFLITDKNLYEEDDYASDDRMMIGEYREMESSPYNDRRVLIVEDDTGVLSFLRVLLSRYFVVTGCTDVQEALDVMDKKCDDVSLVITDVMMPGIDGYEFVRKLKAKPEWTTIPVIMLTAISDTKDKTKALGLGIDAFLTKPFDKKILIATCCNLIEKYDMLKHSFTKVEVKEHDAPKVIKDDKDKNFVEVLELWIESHLGDPALNVDIMAEAMQLGRTAFYEKVKSLLGITPNDYLKKRRMEAAASMLAYGNRNVAEVAYKTGFSDPHYFSQAFKKYYGVTPKKFQKGESDK